MSRKKSVFFYSLAFSLFFTAPALFADEEKSLSQPKFGMLLTLSGAFASAGEDCRQGIEAAQNSFPINDRLHLQYADSKNEVPTALSEFHRLAKSSGVSAVYTHRGSIGMPLNPVSASLKTPLLAAVGPKEFTTQSKYAFQLWPGSDDEGQFLAKELFARGYRRLAIISTEDEWTGAVSLEAKKKFVALGGTLVFDQSVLPGENDFRTLLQKLKQQSPDAFLINLLLPQLAPLIRQAREIGLEADYFSNFYVAKKEVLDALSTEARSGIRYVEIDTELSNLKESLKIPKASAIPGLAVASYVATKLLSQASADLKRSPKDFPNLYSALLHQKEVKTPDYTYPIED